MAEIKNNSVKKSDDEKFDCKTQAQGVGLDVQPGLEHGHNVPNVTDWATPKANIEKAVVDHKPVGGHKEGREHDGERDVKPVRGGAVNHKPNDGERDKGHEKAKLPKPAGGSTPAGAVSYTHLTLPTILLV